VERYDWSDNRHKTKVKTGGDVIKGEAIVSDYISYKSPTGWMCALGFSQLTPDDPLLVGYSINFNKGEEANNNRMPAEMFEHALAEFEADLKSILEGTPTFRNVDESFAEYANMDTISAEAADRILQGGYELRKK
jgi:hypothetical protein